MQIHVHKQSNRNILHYVKHREKLSFESMFPKVDWNGWSDAPSITIIICINDRNIGGSTMMGSMELEFRPHQGDVFWVLVF